jgi:hypothetical protein
VCQKQGDSVCYAEQLEQVERLLDDARASSSKGS